jgi:hypothetical protein
MPRPDGWGGWTTERRRPAASSTGRFPFGVDTDAIPCDVCGAIACDVDHGTTATAAPVCGCMTEDRCDGLGERIVEHSLRCQLHPLHDPDACPGCGRSFAGARGVKAHRSAPFTAMGCKL